MKKSDPPIITKQIFDVSRKDLWTAISDPNEMKKWYFDIMPDFKAEVGFKTNFLISVEDRSYTHLWEVTEVTHQEMIKCRWTYEEHVGDSYISFIISEQENKCLLTVSCIVTEDFPQDLPEFKRESAIGGWNFLIKKRLLEHLNN